MIQQLDTPVVLIIFNRPGTTNHVFERIRQVRPRILLVVADGPRKDKADEPSLCRQARHIVEKVDWPCEVMKNYSEANLGCGTRVATGLDWVFQQVDEAIILEDDCVPDLSFFRFSHELLDRYKYQDRIMQVSGSNFLFGRRSVTCSYYFSRYSLCWGWATWRRAWRLFDFEMQSWLEDPEQCLRRFDNRSERAFWQRTWDSIAKGGLNVWAGRWALTCFNANGLSAAPTTNLVANVGFGSKATHTRSRLLAVRPAVGALRFPLVHPATIERNVQADEYTARRTFYERSIGGKVLEIGKRRLLALLSHMNAKRLRQATVAAILTSSTRS